MKRTVLLLMMLLAAASAAVAQTATDTVYVERGTIVIFTDTAAIREVPLPPDPPQQSTKPIVRKNETKAAKPSQPPRSRRDVAVRFAWGADIGPAIDMSGNDMSSFDFDLAFGLSRGWLNFLGVGAQANIAISNSCRSYPFFLLFRTNFTDRPTRLFWELKGGASLNYLEHNHQQTGIYGSTGLGVKLAESSKFTSHMVLSYSYLQRRRIVGAEMTHDFTDLHFVAVKIGLAF